MRTLMDKLWILCTVSIVILLSLIMIVVVTKSAHSLGNNNGDILPNTDNVCKQLKDKLHHFKVIEESGDSGSEDEDGNNITKQAQEALNTLHDYISECKMQ